MKKIYNYYKYHENKIQFFFNMCAVWYVKKKGKKMNFEYKDHIQGTKNKIKCVEQFDCVLKKIKNDIKKQTEESRKIYFRLYSPMIQNIRKNQIKNNWCINKSFKQINQLINQLINKLTVIRCNKIVNTKSKQKRHLGSYKLLDEI